MIVVGIDEVLGFWDVVVVLPKEEVKIETEEDDNLEVVVMVVEFK